MKKMFGIGWKFLFVVCILIGIVFLCFLFKSGENKIQAFAEQALRETIACDYHQRYAAEVSFRSLPTGKKIKELILMTEQGEETIVFKDSMEEHLAHQLATQYILAQCRPINPDQFNALFRDKMKEKADVRQTGIVYRYKDSRQYSGNDSVSCKGAICSEVHALDIKNTACIQAWVECPPAVIWRHADGKVWAIAALYAVFASLALWRIRRKKDGPLVEVTLLSAPSGGEGLDPVRVANHLDALSQCM